MNASSASLTRLGRTKSLVLAALVAAFGMLALAGTSKAAPTDHQLTVDHGKLTLGAVFPDNTIIPAPVAGSHCPTLQLIDPGAFVPPADPDDCGPSPLSALVPNYPDGNAHIKVTVDGSTASVSNDPADFKTPLTYVPNPTDPTQMVPIKTTVPNGLEGTWNAESGELALTGDLRITVYTGADQSVNPPALESCQIDAPNITWSTGENAVTPGIPFTNGLDGNGAISAQWADLPNGTEINDGDCSTVNSVIHDTGAIWFGVGESTPPPPPVCPEGTEGLWPDCDPVEQPKMNITAVKLLPKKKAIKAGKKLKLKVRVVNKGDKGGKVTVKLNLKKKKGVKLPKKVTLKVGANKAAVKAVVFKTNRKAKGKYKVVAVGQGAAKGKRANSVITVKKAKKKKRK